MSGGRCSASFPVSPLAETEPHAPRNGHRPCLPPPTPHKSQNRVGSPEPNTCAPMDSPRFHDKPRAKTGQPPSQPVPKDRIADPPPKKGLGISGGKGADIRVSVQESPKDTEHSWPRVQGDQAETGVGTARVTRKKRGLQVLGGESLKTKRNSGSAPPALAAGKGQHEDPHPSPGSSRP